MGVLKKLLKNEMMNILTLNNMFDTQKGKVKSPGFVIVGVVAFATLIGGLSCIYSFFLAMGLKQLNALDLLPVVLFVAGSLVMFFFGALRSGNVLFVSTDYDLLMSMPIKSRTIILSKLISLYVSDLACALIIMLPCLFVWWKVTSPTLLSLLLSVLCLPFLPIIPLMLATLVGTIVTFLSGRSRHKTLVGVVANLILVFGIFYAVQLVGTSASAGADIAGYMMTFRNQLFSQYPPARLFFEATQGSVTSFLLLAAISVVASIAFTLLTAAVFKALHSKLSNITMKASKAKLVYSENGTFSALFKKEMRRFFASTTYVVNSGIGSIIGIVAVVYIVFFGKEYVTQVMAVPEMSKMLIALMPLFSAALAAVSCTTPSSVSIEGNSLWVVKHLPVSAYSVFMAKIMLNLLITVPTSLLISITGIVLLKASGIYLVLILVFPVIICVFMAYIGLLLNLSFPNFTWTNETKVIKQSASMGISTFAGIGIIIVIFLFINLFMNTGKAYLVYIAIGAVMVAAIIAADQHLRKNSQKILLRL